MLVENAAGGGGGQAGAGTEVSGNQIEQAEARPDYRLWIRFADGVEGEVDVSELAGKGVFAAWKDPAVFQAVAVDAESGTVVWPGGLDLAPNALYKEVAPVRTS